MKTIHYCMRLQCNVNRIQHSQSENDVSANDFSGCSENEESSTVQSRASVDGKVNFAVAVQTATLLVDGLVWAKRELNSVQFMCASNALDTICYGSTHTHKAGTYTTVDLWNKPGYHAILSMHVCALSV